MFKKYIEKLINEKLDKTIKAYQKEIKELKAVIKEYQKKDPIKLDYDTISALVRKANKDPNLKVEVKWASDGPWMKINTQPFEEPTIQNINVLKPEEL